VKDFTQVNLLCERLHTSFGFFCAIGYFVMAITSAEAEVPHAPIHEPGDSPRGPKPEGRLIMMAMITVALFVVVLALPGLMAVLIGREIDSEQNAR
jgi:hypothetical protein